MVFTSSFAVKSEYLKVTQSTKRARARGIEGNVVLMLKIPIELQCDYSGGFLSLMCWIPTCPPVVKIRNLAHI